jgi:exodeoxyribonuclease VIII
MTTRIDYAMPAAVYHGVDALSASGAKTLLRSPERYAWERDHPSEPSAAMRFGSLVHCMVLEPQQVAARYIARPAGIDGKTKEGKAMLDALRAEAGDREIVDAAEFERAERMHNAFSAAVYAAGIGGDEAGNTEVSLFWDGDRCRMKARLDALLPDGALDLKTHSGDLDDDSLRRTIFNYQYHLQAAHYLDGLAAVGLPCERFVFAFVTSQPPHVCRLVSLSHEALYVGRALRDQAAAVYARCLVHGWRSEHAGAVTEIGLPPWARNRAELMTDDTPAF